MSGNDWVIQWLLGTPYWPDFSEAILFIEVPGFRPDIVHNRLHQFKQAGLFDKIQGILLGYSVAKEGYRLEDIVTEVTEEYHFPIVKTDDFGHNCPNTVLPVGGRVRLDASRSGLEILELCVL